MCAHLQISPIFLASILSAICDADSWLNTISGGREVKTLAPSLVPGIGCIFILTRHSDTHCRHSRHSHLGWDMEQSILISQKSSCFQVFPCFSLKLVTPAMKMLSCPVPYESDCWKYKIFEWFIWLDPISTSIYCSANIRSSDGHDTSRIADPRNS